MQKALYLNFFEIQCLFYNTILPKEIILVSLKSFHIGCPIGTIPVGCADHIFGSILIDVLTEKSYLGAMPFSPPSTFCKVSASAFRNTFSSTIRLPSFA